MEHATDSLDTKDVREKVITMLRAKGNGSRIRVRHDGIVCAARHRRRRIRTYVITIRNLYHNYRPPSVEWEFDIDKNYVAQCISALTLLWAGVKSRFIAQGRCES